MNEQPISYFQTDPRWATVDYSAKGEKTTIGKSGCGPTAMSMVLATWCDKNVTPKTECKWALDHGYKAPHQGTYNSYFVPAAKRYNLTCYQLNSASIYGNANSSHHITAQNALKIGDLVIACMGKGLWTSSGHYVLVYGVEGNVVYINDPASTKIARTHGNYHVFKQQVKYYWVIKRPSWIDKKEDEVNMTKDEVRELIKSEVANQLEMTNNEIQNAKEPGWSVMEGYWERATEKGIVDGTAPERPAKRDEVVAMLARLGLF